MGVKFALNLANNLNSVTSKRADRNRQLSRKKGMILNFALGSWAILRVIMNQHHWRWSKKPHYFKTPRIIDVPREVLWGSWWMAPNYTCLRCKHNFWSVASFGLCQFLARNGDIPKNGRFGWWMKWHMSCLSNNHSFTRSSECEFLNPFSKHLQHSINCQDYFPSPFRTMPVSKFAFQKLKPFCNKIMHILLIPCYHFTIARASLPF